jgi:hypothetical protein
MKPCSITPSPDDKRASHYLKYFTDDEYDALNPRKTTGPYLINKQERSLKAVMEVDRLKEEPEKEMNMVRPGGAGYAYTTNGSSPGL